MTRHVFVIFIFFNKIETRSVRGRVLKNRSSLKKIKHGRWVAVRVSKVGRISAWFRDFACRGGCDECMRGIRPKGWGWVGEFCEIKPSFDTHTHLLIYTHGETHTTNAVGAGRQRQRRRNRGRELREIVEREKRVWRS